MTDAHMLIHVGGIEVLPEPADVTPVEIPFPFTGGMRGGYHDLKTSALLGSLEPGVSSSVHQEPQGGGCGPLWPQCALLDQGEN